MKYLIVLVNRKTEEKSIVKRCSCSLHEAGNKMNDYVKKHKIDLSKFYCYLKEDEGYNG